MIQAVILGVSALLLIAASHVKISCNIETLRHGNVSLNALAQKFRYSQQILHNYLKEVSGIADVIQF